MDFLRDVECVRYAADSFREVADLLDKAAKGEPLSEIEVVCVDDYLRGQFALSQAFKNLTGRGGISRNGKRRV